MINPLNIEEKFELDLNILEWIKVDKKLVLPLEYLSFSTKDILFEIDNKTKLGERLYKIIEKQYFSSNKN